MNYGIPNEKFSSRDVVKTSIIISIELIVSGQLYLAKNQNNNTAFCC